MASATMPSNLELQVCPPELGTGVAGDSENAPAEPSRASGWSRRWVWGLAALALLSGELGFHWWKYARTHVTTDNAFVCASIHQISSRVAGTISAVLVNDNQPVRAGLPLVELDPRDFNLRVEQARSQVAQADAMQAQAQAQRQQASAQSSQAEARLAKAAAELQRARLDFERAEHLTEGGRFAAISKQEYDALQAAYESARAGAQLAQAELKSAGAMMDSAAAACAVAQAQHHTAEVQLADAELQLSYTVIPAPVSGTIGRKTVEVGQRVQPGQALLAVVANEKWIVANFKETQLARMQPGQRVSVRFDAIPGRSFGATVDSFSPASGAQFALLPPDNATGNFTKIVQRVPVKIVLVPAAIRGFESRIVPGLSAFVAVDVTVNTLCSSRGEERD